MRLEYFQLIDRIVDLDLGDGEVGEDLAVDLDAREAEAGHEPAVGRAVLAAGGVDALDPQAAEVALAGAPVAIGVLQAVHHLLVGGAAGTALVAVVALGALERDATLLLGVDGSLHPGHGELLSSIGVRGGGGGGGSRGRRTA